MKIINLPRGHGKTTRLLYASEFTNTPILCANQASKQHLQDSAKKLNLKIPEPITPSDVTMDGVFKTSMRNQDVLVDEAPMVLQSLLSCLGMNGRIKAITLTEDDDNIPIERNCGLTFVPLYDNGKTYGLSILTNDDLKENTK